MLYCPYIYCGAQSPDYAHGRSLGGTWPTTVTALAPLEAVLDHVPPTLQFRMLAGQIGEIALKRNHDVRFQGNPVIALRVLCRRRTCDPLNDTRRRLSRRLRDLGRSVTACKLDGALTKAGSKKGSFMPIRTLAEAISHYGRVAYLLTDSWAAHEYCDD